MPQEVTYQYDVFLNRSSKDKSIVRTIAEGRRGAILLSQLAHGGLRIGPTAQTGAHSDWVQVAPVTLKSQRTYSD